MRRANKEFLLKIIVRISIKSQPCGKVINIISQDT